jgi:putative salt-induced outer membrane protein YdiY
MASAVTTSTKAVSAPSSRHGSPGSSASRPEVGRAGRPGPARDHEIAFSARVGGDLSWAIRPGLVFTQNATVFPDSVSSTLTSSPALTAKLRGDLSARASCGVRMESEPPAGREHTDTQTRASLIYNF